jgi:GntR family transcriptional repressor for pyruvate dehydrogenase complex
MSANNMIERVPRVKLADAVALQLERLIIEGEYKIGEKLPPERVLAENFGVGRSSMREALRMVEAGGLLRTDHGVGVFVVSNEKTTLLPSDLILTGDYTVPDLFEARLALEREGASLAARKISAAQVANLQSILEQAAVPGITDYEFIKLDGQLHQAISAASGNQLLVDLSKSIEHLFVVYSHRVIRLPGRRETAHAGHVLIVEAVAGGDSAGAEIAVANHLAEVQKDIEEHLEAVL